MRGQTSFRLLCHLHNNLLMLLQISSHETLFEELAMWHSTHKAATCSTGIPYADLCSHCFTFYLLSAKGLENQQNNGPWPQNPSQEIWQKLLAPDLGHVDYLVREPEDEDLSLLPLLSVSPFLCIIHSNKQILLKIITYLKWRQRENFAIYWVIPPVSAIVKVVLQFEASTLELIVGFLHGPNTEVPVPSSLTSQGTH